MLLCLQFDLPLCSEAVESHWADTAGPNLSGEAEDQNILKQAVSVLSHKVKHPWDDSLCDGNGWESHIQPLAH